MGRPIVTVLDLATARARYSLWLGANPPRLVQRPDAEPEGAAADDGALVESEDAAPDDSHDAAPTENSDKNPERPPPKNIDDPPGERVVLRQLRHPLLVWQAQHEDGPEVVPIDVIITPQIRVVAITGPNTGGKTVTLKTIGLAALMAKVGLFIPAREPVELPWFDQVLADIGDEQSIEQSLSTFSGHIRRIGRVLGALTPSGDRAVANALVLLDEVEAGTETLAEIQSHLE